MPGTWPRASELMTKDPITATAEQPVSHALGIMRAKRIHEVPVLRGSKIVGMVVHDALARRHRISLTTKLEHIMVVAPVVPPAAELPDIAHTLLASGRRAACVVDPRRGALLGIVSRTDLVRACRGLPSLAEARVVEVMSPAQTVLQETDTIRTLYEHMRALEEHPLPVADRAGRVVGAVGITDLGSALWRPLGAGARDADPSPEADLAQIRSIATRPALTLPRESTVGQAAKLMVDHRTSSVFVTEGERALGVVSQSDILALAVRQLPSHEGVYTQITGMAPGTDPGLLSDLDAALAKGVKRLARITTPRMLTLHVGSQAGHRTGEVDVEARLFLQDHIYNAHRSDFNLVKAAVSVMEELERQVRSGKEGARERGRRSSHALRSATASEEPVDADLETRLASALPRPPNRGPGRRA